MQHQRPLTLTNDWLDLVEGTSLDVHRWRRSRPDLFPGCRTADDVLGAIRGNSDAVLAFLVVEHQLEHPHAGRLVWHSMLPKMRRMADLDARATLSDYTGHLWLRLGSYPLTARPCRLAANLALDTLKAVKAEQVQWRTMSSGAIDQLEALDEVTAQRVLVLARELDLIDAATEHLLTTVYTNGHHGTDAAASLGLSRSTVRYRCSAAIRRLRAHSEELVGA